MKISGFNPAKSGGGFVDLRTIGDVKFSCCRDFIKWSAPILMILSRIPEGYIAIDFQTILLYDLFRYFLDRFP